MDIKGRFSSIINAFKDMHIPLGIGVFAIGTMLAWYGHMSADYVGFTSTVFAFLGAHHYVENKFGGDNRKDGQDGQ